MPGSRRAARIHFRGRSFAVFLPPGQEQNEEKTLKLADGNATLLVYGVEASRNVVFLTETYELPERPKNSPAAKPPLDQAIADLVKARSGARLTRNTRIPAREPAGKEILLSGPGNRAALCRVYLVKNRIVVLRCEGPADKLPAGDIKTFCDSFRLTKAK